MRISYKNKTELAQYVSARLDRLRHDSVLTMIIAPGISEGSYVLTVTDMSLEDTAKVKDQTASVVLSSTSKQNTPAG